MLEHYLRMYCSWDQEDWVELLPYVEFCYNNTVHSSTKQTPFFSTFGYYPENNYLPEEVLSKVPTAEKFTVKLNQLCKDMSKTVKQAEVRMKNYYDRKVEGHEPRFKVGD